MPNKNSETGFQSKKIEEEINPRNAKLVLFIFGIGPIVLLGIFLASKGFFS